MLTLFNSEQMIYMLQLSKENPILSCSVLCIHELGRKRGREEGKKGGREEGREGGIRLDLTQKSTIQSLASKMQDFRKFTLRNCIIILTLNKFT